MPQHRVFGVLGFAEARAEIEAFLLEENHDIAEL